MKLIAATLTFVTFMPHSGWATCLEEAADFAQRICGEVKNRGSSTLLQANGQLTAEAKGLIRQTLGNVGGNLQGQTETTAYENVLREQLAGELVNARQCGIQMAKAAMDKVCVNAPGYKTCEHPSFGLSRWANEEVLNGTSGWRGGGYNPTSYCTEFTNSVISSRGLGNQPHLVEQLSKSEEDKSTGFMGSGPHEYNYHCSIRLHWQPIYKQGTGPACGKEQ